MRIRLSRSIVPNLFTVLNIYFGFLSILHAMQDKIELACWYIIFAAACDTLDGIMARLTKSASEFGVELDSLADVVSFGAAPSVLAYVAVLKNYEGIGLLLAAVPLVFGALRLARFNVQLVGFDKNYFIGVPTPVNALTIVSFIFFFTIAQIETNIVLQRFFIGLIVGLGLLMVSTIKYPVLPKFSRRSIKERPVPVAITAIAGVLIIATTGKALFPVLLSVVLFGIIMTPIRWLRKISTQETVLQETPDDQPDSMTS